jgi:hypothetical protein
MKQAAVAIYCINSLQSLSVLPNTPHLRDSRRTFSRLLQKYLGEAMEDPRTILSTTWPLIVLGVEAAHGDAEMRNFVRNALPRLSATSGSYRPLEMKEALEKFWASGETSWDACFDKPHVFVMQLTVNVVNI